MTISIIVAISENNAIGKNNQLLWHLPADLKHFKNITSGHSIIMGRKTFDSIGRPLPNRRNIVVTRDPAWRHDGVEAVTSLAGAVTLAGPEDACIIGGAQIFSESIDLADQLIVTEID